MTILNTATMISYHDFASIWQDVITSQQSLWSNQSFAPGDVLTGFYAGDIMIHPTYLTVQVAEHEHITLKPQFLQYINHSCNPNVFFDTTSMQLICLRPIPANAELTFFYPSTEWQMTQSFDCHCSAYNCLGHINGAASIPTEILNNYRLTDFILGKLRAKKEVQQIMLTALVA